MDRFFIRKKRVREEEVPVDQPIGDSDGVSKAQQPPELTKTILSMTVPGRKLILGLNMTQVIKVCYVLFVRNITSTNQRCLGY